MSDNGTQQNILKMRGSWLADACEPQAEKALSRLRCPSWGIGGMISVKGTRIVCRACGLCLGIE